MKLYSRNQLIFGILLTAAVTASVLVFSGVVDRIRNGSSLSEEKQVVLEIDRNPAKELILPAQDNSEYSADEQVNIRIYRLYNEGVVNITTEKLVYWGFFDPFPREGGTGSGSIIDSRGYVLTNYHVVEDAYKVYLTLADGSRHEGEVIGKDQENDLAVVKFDPGNIELVTIPFGSSADLSVGQKVLAIGNPFAFERTLTTGIISGLGRPVIGANNFVIQDMIQTDASINPGNSGGPLLNTSGEMIGVNTMIYSPSGGSVGIGFASPIDTARRVLPDLIEFGVVRRGWIEIVPVQLDANIVRHSRLPVEKGILVSSAIDGGNAEDAGIEGGRNRVRYGRSYIYLGGDIIIGIDGITIESLTDFFGALEATKPGDTVEVLYIRNGRERRTTVVLSERPEKMTWN
jgi:S1-C subfamily serine protease